ncbi:YbjN domain-containing protein [Jidongwangia harbinensis]|uniref:YbjN domain-containing protein n=1 Tax=Jidongwangia harbinensis TaxID=2878561 RepID=UPI001CDA1A2F|nr:YbjN domain-containing protein [Jidongwangia harbinensis]MCA2216754.1 YbjN domain-containing protein [Jidongwangia harbinensis]
MPWWSWRPGSTRGDQPEAGGEVALQSSVRIGVPAQREPVHSGVSAVSAEVSTIDEPDHVLPVTLDRIGKALDLLDIRFLADGGGSLLAMWERHAVLFTLEGPDDEILVMRARPHSTVPPDWADRAYRVVNEWNHTRRFCKAYVGDPTERGQLPIYAELQVPLNSGAHDALLVEMLDCGAAVATSFVDWLHDEGALL